MTVSPGSPPRDVLIFTSPKAGSGDGWGKVSDLASVLRSWGIAVEVTAEVTRLQQRTSHRADVVESGVGGRPDLVVSAGGDGTLALVAQNTPADTLLTPMPLGTENLVAKHYRLSNDVADMADTIRGGWDRRIDAGEANGRLFLVMATCGFDAEVVRAMHLTRRGHISRFSYFGPIVRAMRRYDFPELVVSVTSPAGSQTEVPCRWAMVFNLPRYAASLPIELSADEHDGQLDFCAFTRGGLLGGFRYLAAILARRHIQWQDVVRGPITECRVTSSRPVAYQLDGDYAGRLPLVIGVLPGRIRLRLPAAALPLTATSLHSSPAVLQLSRTRRNVSP